MKKRIMLIIPLLILTGCTNKKNIFEKYARQYYENHMIMINNIDEITITLEDLKNISNEDGYNLKKIKKCQDTSKIIFTINKETKEIENTKIDLKC